MRPVNSMVSAVSPGPNDMPQPSKPPGFFSISSITNMTVGEDMLPYRRSTSRDGLSAAGSRFSALSTASRTVRPPGCTAQRSIASGGRPPRMASWLLRSACWTAAGTWPERTMSKPWSRISQVLSSRCSSATAQQKLSSSMPGGSAVTSVAAQPSPQRQKDKSFSSSVVSRRCSVQSSMLTSSTLACGSERTMWRASLRPLTAA